MAGGSRGPAAPMDTLNSFGLRQGTPEPSWEGLGAVTAALTWTETETSCDHWCVEHGVLYQVKDGKGVNKVIEDLNGPKFSVKMKK